jgi:serine O-acetyltransferase
MRRPTLSIAETHSAALPDARPQCFTMPPRGPARAAGNDLPEQGLRAGTAALASRVPLWVQVEREAFAAAACEPALRALLDALVLSHATPACIVAAVLSRRLAGGDAGLTEIVGEALAGDRDILECVEGDLEAVTARDPACRSALHALVHLKGFQALAAHRVAHSLWTRGRGDAASWLSHQTSVALGVDIHPAVPFGQRVLLDHATGIVVGETAVVEDDVSILQGVTLGATGKQRGDRHPKVRRGASIGAGAQVLGNLEIGRMSRVGAGSVVLHDVPAHATVVGVPARVVRMRAPQRAAA